MLFEFIDAVAEGPPKEGLRLIAFAFGTGGGGGGGGAAGPIKGTMGGG